MTVTRLFRDCHQTVPASSLVVALAEWPRTGVPANAGAWLMAVARRRAIDALRRGKMRTRKLEEIARRTYAGTGDVDRCPVC